MKTRRLLTIAVGIMVLSAGVFLMTATSSAEKDLSGVTQNWDKVLPASERFVVLEAFNNAAVRDNETGLVWERSPDATSNTWSAARFICATKIVGGRKGWRLPSFAELASLVDTSVAPNPLLPPGHPFANVQPNTYWSATTGAEFPAGAWTVSFEGTSAGVV